MDWRRIPHANGYEMSEAGDVRRADGSPVPPLHRLSGGGRHTVMSAETLYRMTFDGPLPSRTRVDEGRLDAAQRLVEMLQRENDELRARFAASGIEI